MENTLYQLNEIRKQLKRGSLDEISKRCNKHKQTVIDVFKGKYENFEIMQTIIEVYKEQKEKRLQLQIELNEAIND